MSRADREGVKVDFDIEALVQAATAARRGAYAPYSDFAVGAALLTASGQVYAGCNVENASYGLTICAERVAAFKAVCAGERDWIAMAVVSSGAASPCGACRQVLREFGPDLVVIIADTDGHWRRVTMAELLPESFGPEHLASRA